jgi:predicted nucleic acid-binding protein
MIMRLAITDACIFIDLYYLQLTALFFSLDLQVHTSIDVLSELYENQLEILSAFQLVGKLTAHNITEGEKKKILSLPCPRSLSESDKTVLYLASKLNAMVLSSDKAVRNTAKKNSIPYHGMIWIFDQLVANNLISNSEASAKLKQLIMTNLVYQNNKELVEEMQKRLVKWER